MMTTSNPASASTIAAVLPPGPEPTTITLSAMRPPLEHQRHGLVEVRDRGADRKVEDDRIWVVGLSDLPRRVTARLRIARVTDLLPPREPFVPAVLRDRVRAFDRVDE